MASTGTVKQKFIVEVDKDGNLKAYNSNLKKVSRSTDQASKATDGLGVSTTALAAGGIAALVMGTKKLIDYQTENVEYTKKQILADTRLTNIARGVAKATDLEIKSLKNLADTMQDLTGIGDEAVEMGQSQLLSFGITAKSAEKLTESMLDLAVATYHTDVDGDKLIQTVNLMGKALNGLPGALSRVGVLLDDNQAKMMKEGNEAERVATMIKIIEQNYDDLARAIGDTPLGVIQRLDSEMGDLREEMGESFLPVIVEFKTAQKELMEQFADTDGLESFNKLLMETVKLAGETISWWTDFFTTNSAERIAELPDKIGKAEAKLAKDRKRRTDDWVRYDRAAKESVWGKVARAKSQAAADEIMDSWDKQSRKIEEMKSELISLKNARDGIEAAGTTSGGGGEIAQLEKKIELYSQYHEAIGPKFQEDLLRLRIMDQSELGLGDLPEMNSATALGPAPAEDLLLAQIMDTSELDTTLDEVGSFMDEYGSIIQSGMNTIGNIFSSVYSRQMEEISMKSKAEIDAVKKSTLSEKQKAKEIDKINAKSAKEQKKIREKQWGSDVLMSISNTGLAVTNQMTSGDPYSAIPRAIAVGVLGAAQTGLMLANKPKYYYGSKDSGGNYSEVNGFGSGDTVDAKLKPKELIVEAGKAGAVKSFLNGKLPAGGGDTYSYQIAPVIQISGDVTADSEERITSTFVALMENEEFLNNLNPALVG